MLDAPTPPDSAEEPKTVIISEEELSHLSDEIAEFKAKFAGAESQIRVLNRTLKQWREHSDRLLLENMQLREMAMSMMQEKNGH